MILIMLSRDLFNGFFRSRIGAKVRISIGSNRSCQLIRKLQNKFFFCEAPLKTRPVTYRLDLVLSNGQRPFMMKFLMHYPPRMNSLREKVLF